MKPSRRDIALHPYNTTKLHFSFILNEYYESASILVTDNHGNEFTAPAQVSYNVPDDGTVHFIADLKFPLMGRFFWQPDDVVHYQLNAYSDNNQVILVHGFVYLSS